MRARILPTACMAALSLGCARDRGAPPPTSGTVVAGQPFTLQWPAGGRARACIEMLPDAVPEGTEVTISQSVDAPGKPSEWPGAFRGWHEKVEGRTVYMPLVEFSASPAFTITDSKLFFTVGICARYNDKRNDPKDPPGRPARVAHPAPQGDTLELLDRVANPCDCPGQGSQEALGPASLLIAGSPLAPARLHAAVAEEGLGGKGGSFSPFGVVRPSPSE